MQEPVVKIFSSNAGLYTGEELEKMVAGGGGRGSEDGDQGKEGDQKKDKERDVGIHDNWSKPRWSPVQMVGGLYRCLTYLVNIWLAIPRHKLDWNYM